MARRAGVSRGAQQNYFPHKQTLVMEAVRHLGRLQREAVRDRVQGVPSGRARVQTGLDVLFEAYGGPLFASVVELSLAARHDAVLHEVITSEERATSRAMQETATYIFGEDFPESREAGAALGHRPERDPRPGAAEAAGPPARGRRAPVDGHQRTVARAVGEVSCARLR